MNRIINNLKGSTMWLVAFLVMMVMSVAATSCSDDKEPDYITDTQLSVLQESRSSLNYLLKNSTYGTVPGTFPHSSKQILENAIAAIDKVIDRVQNGEVLGDDEFERTVAAANQAIDQFKDQRLYNLSEEVRTYIKNMMAKADEIRAMIADESLWGNRKGQYPIEGKAQLESAAIDLEEYAERLKSGSIADMTQDMYDEAIAKAQAVIDQVKASAWPDNSNITWNLFVDGNAGSYIDFGYSEDYVKFGEQDNQAFTIELWVNITEYCDSPGEDNCALLSTLTQTPYWSGWCVQDRMKGLLRTMVGHWEDNNYTNPRWWEPGWKKSDNWTKDRWTHYAFIFRDKGLPGWDTPTDVKCYSIIDGSRQGEVIRVGEPWRTYIADNCIANKEHLYAYCTMYKNEERAEWWSGYIKKVRIWRTNRTEDQVYRTYIGVEEDVTADNPDLVEAWDIEVKGDQPTGNTFVGLKGHEATIVGTHYEWRESSTIPSN